MAYAVSLFSQLANTYQKKKKKYISKSTVETLEQGIKYVQIYLVSLLLTLYIFDTSFCVSIVNFEPEISGWAR